MGLMMRLKPGGGDIRKRQHKCGPHHSRADSIDALNLYEFVSKVPSRIRERTLASNVLSSPGGQPQIAIQEAVSGLGLEQLAEDCRKQKPAPEFVAALA